MDLLPRRIQPHAMEGKDSEDPRRIALPQPLRVETKQKTCLSQACSRNTVDISSSFETLALLHYVLYSVIIFHHEAELDAYLNLLSNLQDDPYPVYHETVIMFILVIVIGQ